MTRTIPCASESSPIGLSSGARWWRRGKINRGQAQRTWLLTVVMVGMLVAPVFAEKSVQLVVRAPEVRDVKKRGQAPEIEATIIGVGSAVPPEKLLLTQTDAKQALPPLKATSVRSYLEGPEPLALIVLVEGMEVWMGNETYQESTDLRYVGVLTKLAPAIDKFGKAGPEGSQGGVMTYANTVETKLAMGPLVNLSGSALGSQRDYANNIHSELVTGVTKAMAELMKTNLPRKCLVIIGDGGDTNAEASRQPLVELKRQAAAANVEIYAINYTTSLAPENKVIGNLVPSTNQVLANTSDALATSIDGVLARISDRLYATFPGYDPALKAGFTWDGLEHEFALKIDRDQLDPVTLVLSPVWQPSKPGFPWLWVVGGTLGGLLLVGGLVALTRKPPPAPMVVAEPVKAAAPSTVFHETANGVPIVGWLVVLDGPDAYQTFVLKPGPTKIGKGSPADVVVRDDFMSTEHCLIAGSPIGFQFQDLKSLNGSQVNGKRVERHELVDNDELILGNTKFKFKSIN